MEHLTRDSINEVPNSNWYKYTLGCSHTVYSRTRIVVNQTYHEHYIRCPQCKHQNVTSEWSPIVKMEAVTDEHVSNVHSGTSYVLSRRILRTDGTSRTGRVIPSGNPFPYSSSDRDYV